MMEFFQIFFAILITIVSYLIGLWCAKKNVYIKKFPLVVFCSIIAAMFLIVFEITVKDYVARSHFVVDMLGPVTVALAYPLVEFFKLIKQNWLPIFVGVFVSVFTSLVSGFALAKFFKLEDSVIASILPKCVTAPIAIDISTLAGGMASLTIVAVTIAGLSGYTFGYFVLRKLSLKNELSYGLAIGSVSHMIGTARCAQENKSHAAIAGLTLVLAAIATAFIAPIFFSIVI